MYEWANNNHSSNFRHRLWCITDHQPQLQVCPHLLIPYLHSTDTQSGSATATHQPPPPLPPAAGHDQHPAFSPHSLHCQPVPPEQQSQPTPLSADNTDTLDHEDQLDPRDIGSIPCPPSLSHANLQIAMRLIDGEKDDYRYNKIRVSAST